MRDVAIASFAQTKYVRNQNRLTEVDMLLPVIQQAIEGSGIPKQEIGFTCHGSSDYLAGQSFAFVGAVDALGAWPPIAESHVEMDGAWALYEAWVKIQCGECDSALVFGVGRASMGKLPETLNLQLDPYTVAPLGLDSISSAALQARAMIDAGKISEKQMAEIAVRNRAAAKQNPNAQLAGDFEVEKLLAEPYLVSPLRKHDCPPISDGVSAVVIVAGDAIGSEQVFCAEAGGVEGEAKAGMDKFRADFKAKFNVDVQLYAPYVYDATKVMVAAMVKAGSSDPAKYLPVLAATADYKGVTGPIAFDEKGDIKNGALTLFTYKGQSREQLAVIR